jgi:uncharacterized membrane protein
MQKFMVPIVRGLATLLPPLLTLIIAVWAWRTLDQYIFSPLHVASVSLVARVTADIHDDDLLSDPPEDSQAGDVRYVPTSDERFVPESVMSYVRDNAAGAKVPRTAHDIYFRYVELRWLPQRWFIPASVCALIGLLYVAGHFGNRGLGTFVRARVRRGIERLPFVRKVYAVLIQVTQHMLAQPPPAASRVVAVQFPRKNVWAVAYVVKEGLAEVANEASEPVLTVFMDTSPVPMSGYTIMVKKSETIPLNMSLDEAFKFVMSCGIIVPPQQRVENPA